MQKEEETKRNPEKENEQEQQLYSSASSSRSSSFSDSIAFIQLDELNSYETPTEQNQDFKQSISEPGTSKMITPQNEVQQQAEQSGQILSESQQQSNIEPINADKENQQSSLEVVENINKQPTSGGKVGEEANVGSEDFQMVDMMTDEKQKEARDAVELQRATLSSLPNLNQHSSQLGNSLIDMIINLKNENQNLVKSLESNNEFVKERIEEFKRVTEDAKKRELQYAMDKSEHEHQVRKLQRQNLVLSERLKSMEVKFKDIKLVEANDANSGKGGPEKENQPATNLYPELNSTETFSLNQAAPTTMQVDVTSGELNVENDLPEGDKVEATTSAKAVLDHLLEQCDLLDKQLNTIERRDLEICLLQQKVNVFRKDLGLNQMSNPEASARLELLREEIDGFCKERQRQASFNQEESMVGTSDEHRYAAAAHAIDATTKLGCRLSKRAARSAAKAAKYASKQAYREQKIAIANAMAAAALANSSCHNRSQPNLRHHQQQQQQQQQHETPVEEPQINQQQYQEQHHSRRHHHSSGSQQHPHLSSLRKLKTELVSDLMSTANKAMLTGYKVASTHVNLALDKLSQFEQSQAQHLAKNQPAPNAGPANLHDYYNFDKNTLD